ncbi:MAG TPA: hypothetical protein VE592_08225 [Geminicoccaceae bacterium]|jgi:hypothetical protein|nr:hypothetical protein [Geminicoccaceae bacterium]
MTATEVCEVPGECPGWLDAATSVKRGELVMLKTAARIETRRQEGADGIFGPEWFKWREATLRVTLRDEPPFIARLDDVRQGKGGHYAVLSELDTRGHPLRVREEPWPPEGGVVRVVRAP